MVNHTPAGPAVVNLWANVRRTEVQEGSTPLGKVCYIRAICLPPNVGLVQECSFTPEACWVNPRPSAAGS